MELDEDLGEVIAEEVVALLQRKRQTYENLMKKKSLMRRILVMEER